MAAARPSAALTARTRRTGQRSLNVRTLAMAATRTGATVAGSGSSRRTGPAVMRWLASDKVWTAK